MPEERRSSEEIRAEVREMHLEDCAAAEGHYQNLGLDRDGYYPDEKKPLFLHPEAIAFSCKEPLMMFNCIDFQKLDNQQCFVVGRGADSIVRFYKVNLWPCRHPREVNLERSFLTVHQIEKEQDFFLVYAIPLAILDDYREEMSQVYFRKS